MVSRRGIPLIAVVLTAFAADADSLRDLSLRIDYAYYSGDTAVLDAAIEELDELRRRDIDAVYLHAFAEFRIAALSASQPHQTRALQACLDGAANVIDRDDRNVAAQVLVAMCSLRLAETEPLKALLHERRMARALQLARELDPDHPTVAYVEALANHHVNEDDSSYEAALVRALTLYDERAGRAESAWGEAEAHVSFAALRIAAGDYRRARDAVEAALLAAPGYTAALRLRDRLHSGSP